MEEQVIALPKNVLFAEKSPQDGFMPFCYKHYWDIIKAKHEIVPHKEIENDDNYIQPLIIICVYRPGKQSLFYFKKSEEAKKQEWSIAVNGHIDEIPQISHPLQELGIEFFQKKFHNRQKFSIRSLGYLYSPNHEQTKNHFGLLFLANIDGGLQVCCPKLFKSATVDKNEVEKFINSPFPFDHWTKIAFEAIKKNVYHN